MFKILSYYFKYLILCISIWSTGICSDLAEYTQFANLLAKIYTNQVLPIALNEIPQDDFKRMCRSLVKESTPDCTQDSFVWLSRDHGSQDFAEQELQFSYDDVSRTSLDATTTINQQNYHKFYGRLASYFLNINPIWSTGIAIDSQHVLTTASSINFGREFPYSLTFYAFDEITQDYTNTANIISIMYPKAFSEISSDGDLYNFALLKLATPIVHLKDHVVSFKPLSLPLDQSLILHGFDQQILQRYEIDSLKPERSDDNEFDCAWVHRTIGVCANSMGAPLLHEDAQGYHIVGLHTESAKNMNYVSRALSMDEMTVKRLNLLKTADTQLISHIVAQNPHRPWRQIRVKYIESNKIPVRQDFLETYPQGSDKSYLSLLWEKLHTKQSIYADSTVTITGMGGIGKSTLAAQYVLEALDNRAYKVVYWIASQSEQSIINGYKDLLRSLGVTVSAQAGTNDIKLDVDIELNNRQPSLLIFDDVEDLTFFKQSSPCVGHIILTSRRRHGWKDNHYNLDVFLDVFFSQEAFQYIEAKDGIVQSLENEKNIYELAAQYGYLPLALFQTASYMQETCEFSSYNVSFKNRIKDFKKNPIRHFEDMENMTDQLDMCHPKQEINYEYLVDKTFKMSGNHSSKLSNQLLSYFAYLNSNQICTHAFLDYAQNKFGANQHKFKAAIGQLFKYSLINTSPKISIHPLVQLVTRIECETTDKLPDFDAALTSFHAYLQSVQQQITDHNAANTSYSLAQQQSGDDNRLQRYIAIGGELQDLAANLKSLEDHFNRLSQTQTDKLSSAKNSNLYLQQYLASISSNYQKSIAIEDNLLHQ